MPSIVRTVCAALIVAPPFAVPAAQAAQEDTQLWLAAQASIDLGGPLVLGADVQHRYTDDVSRAGQDVIRASLGYKLDSTTTVMQGYAYARTDPLTGATTHEHRPFQQLGFRIAGDGKGPTLTGRLRLEERFVEGSGDMGLRLRQHVRATVPLHKGLFAFAGGEVMANLNSTDWGQHGGFDQGRLFAGLGVPVAKGVTLEGGYMNQYIARFRRTDRINHNISLTLSIRK